MFHRRSNNKMLSKTAIFLCLLSICLANKHKKFLTESMGQEVIEIGSPLKELPDLEEEPSAENDDDNSTSTTTQVATKEAVVTTTKEIATEKIYGNVDSEKDEEARIEKELSDIYKDSIDYKADGGEVTKDKTESNKTETTEKSIARARNNFKFQPDSDNPKDVAFFRTSIDEISCKKNKLSGVTELPNSSGRIIFDLGFYIVFALQYIITV